MFTVSQLKQLTKDEMDAFTHLSIIYRTIIDVNGCNNNNFEVKIHPRHIDLIKLELVTNGFVIKHLHDETYLVSWL